MLGPEYLPIYIGVIILLLIVMTMQAAEGKYSHNIIVAGSKSGFTCPPERDRSADIERGTYNTQALWIQ
jgi:hypothetical protein